MLGLSTDLLPTFSCPDRLLRPSPNIDLDCYPLRFERCRKQKADRFVIFLEEHVHGGIQPKTQSRPPTLGP